MTNSQELMNTVTEGGAALVDWELYGTKITPTDLRATLVRHGFDPSVVPDIDQTARVKSAGGKWTQGRGGADRFRTEVTEDDDNVFIQILRRGDDGTLGKGAARRKYTQVASLVWDKVNDQWMSDDYPTGWRFTLSDEQANAVRDAVDSCRNVCDSARLNLDHEFIRPVLIQAPLVSLGAVPFIRRKGGAMVIPIQNWDEVKRLQGLVGDLGDSFMGVVRADVSDPGTIRAVTRSVQDSLVADIHHVQMELQEWKERGTRLRASAIGDRLTQFQEIRDRAALYADSLGMVITDLTDTISQSEDFARKLLDVAMGDLPLSALDEGQDESTEDEGQESTEDTTEVQDTPEVITVTSTEGMTVGDIRDHKWTQDELDQIGGVGLGDIARALGVDRVEWMTPNQKRSAILSAQV